MLFKPAIALIVSTSSVVQALVPLQARQETSTSTDSCPGYSVSNVKSDRSSLTADLTLAGSPCNAYGPDISKLKLEVTYETATRIHVKLTDANSKRYEVPEEAFERPAPSKFDSKKADIKFKYTKSPFSFTIYRSSTGEVLFDSSAAPLVYEPQYLRLKTKLPSQANIYGLGEHSNNFRLDPTNTIRTLWNRDAPGVPTGTNLYGTHPIYFEHRTTGTHGVFLLNSNGMDIKLTDGALEYNVIGGILDFYFLSGPSPVEVAQQYANLVGKPAEMPYWAFGLHQCRWGYRDFVEVSQVITNYSAAGIPLETMWTDIDYMKTRWIFTTDPDYFPLDRMQQITKYLHDHNQQYILMMDPAVAYQPNKNYGAYDHGAEADVFLKNADGSPYLGVVWPGLTVFPDWFHPKASDYWTTEIKSFFDEKNGINVDGIWIDMNEAANFCGYPCPDPQQVAIDRGMPPPRPREPPPKDAPIFTKRQNNNSTFDVLNPPYAINHAFPNLSSNTIAVDIKHQNGLIEYDAHSLYGTMMSSITRDAMVKRRPGERALIITRSTFAGAGRKVGKWLGDNASTWGHYRNSIAGALGFASLYQMPMVGADVCGFFDNTTETLCARWAMLGAFLPFYRNHNAEGTIGQEFYLWGTVTQAAKNALSIRYRLLDYIYTHFHRASLDGTPVLNPLWFKYPSDSKTYAVDLQFLYGDSILVSPVTTENSTSVDIYLPKDVFYDFYTFTAVQGSGSTVTLSNISFTDIPLHIRGGAVIPLRTESSMTTKDLRSKDFHLVVAPNSAGRANGNLYIDDGISLAPTVTTNIAFTYSNGELQAKGKFDYNPEKVKVTKISFLGIGKEPKRVSVTGGKFKGHSYDAVRKVAEVEVEVELSHSLRGGFSVKLK
ncbi:hypothetical protein FRC03_004543 [Tulasnella sp. 419]|nr:hypothetical protein FRC03_004543 [Tulasnella sp. 419]